ncbi:MAG: Rrf2 family transcriptional regulator [Chloroflexi bacterium]|nr:Rrf2 family transcriptional regulator [Chloroflexota bacterium]
MWFSSKGHYGLRAMVHLALAYGGGPVALAEIARKENLSADYLEQLFARLRQVGLVESTRGVRGGYRLSFEPASVTAGQVIRALEGPVAPMSCASEGCAEATCDREQHCGSRLLWQRMRDSIAHVLDSTTLAELCEGTGDACVASAG